MPLPLVIPIMGAAAAALLVAKVVRDKKLATPVTVTVAPGTAPVPVLTGTNGVQFVPASPQFSAVAILPPDQFQQIIPSDLITVDAERGGLVSASIPSGNVLFQVVTTPDLTSMTLTAVSKDPRNDINDILPKLIPSAAITGIQPTK